jgi:hypothetical protein
VPQAELLSMLDEAGLLVPVDGGVGPGLDCAVVPTRHEGLSLVSTIDFFYPLVLDPYMQVRRAPTILYRVISDCHPSDGRAENKSNLWIIAIWILFQEVPSVGWQSDITRPS